MIHYIYLVIANKKVFSKIILSVSYNLILSYIKKMKGRTVRHNRKIKFIITMS